MLLIDVNELAAKEVLNYEEIHKAFAALYNLDYNPVAIKLFFDQQEYDNFVPEKVPGPKMTYCQMILASRMDDYIVKADADKLLCDNAQTVFGFREMSEQEINGHVKYTNDWDAAKECLKAKPKLPVGDLKGYMTAPLYKTPVDPDVVLFILSPFQAYHLLNDYMGALKVPNVTSVQNINSAICSGTVGCYLNQSANMNTMCAGSYTSGKTEKNEVNVFIPGSQIEKVARHLVQRTAKYGGASFLGQGGQHYPGMDVCKKCPMVRFKNYEK